MPALVLTLFVFADALCKSYFSTPLQPYSLVLQALCLGYFFYYFRRTPRGAAIWDQFTTQTPALKWNTSIVAAVLFLGSFFRFWKLGSLFDGLTYDESYKGLDAIRIREFGELPIFLDWNGGREALVGYLVAAAQMVFGNTDISVRLVTAIAGCLSLLFFYLFTRTVFNNHIALISTFLMAVSKWHIIHSRYGVRAGLYPLFELGTLYFLSRGLSSGQKRWGSLLAAGIIGGLGLYTYIAYRIFPFVILAYLAERTVRKHLPNQVKPILAASAIAILVIAPLAKFYIVNTDSLTDRMKRTQVWRQPGKEKEGPVRLVLESTVKTLGLYTYKGDPIARHNVDQEPMLSPFTTSFFILGAFLVVIHPRKPYAMFLIFYFLLTILPGILSVGAPNVPRVFGSLPVAILFISFGMTAAGHILLHYSKMAPRALVVIVLSGALLTGIIDTMVRQPAILDSLSPRLAALWGMDRDQENVARLVNRLGNRCEIFLPPQFFFHSTIQYLTYGKSAPRIITPNTDLSVVAQKDKIVVVILQPDQINPWWLRDDEGKRFYYWWLHTHQIEPREFRSAVRRSYDPPFTKTSDWRIVKLIEKNYPDARELQFEHFKAFVFRLPQHSP